MANEGTASIKITGDVRDFARQTERDLNRALASIRVDPVRVPIDTDEIRRDGETAGAEFGDGFSGIATDRVRKSRGDFEKAGEELGSSASKGLKRGADRDSRSFLDRAKETFSKTGDILGKALSGAGGALASVGGTIGTTVGVAFIAAAVAVIVPALAAAVTSGLGLGLGAGLIGLGALFLKDVKPLREAVKGLGEDLKRIGQQAAKPLLKPFLTAIRNIGELARQLRPELTAIFKGLAPVIAPLNQAFGEFLGALVRGVKDSLPGITAAFAGLARVLPEIGQMFGDFFRTIFANEDLIDNTTQGLMRLVFGPLKLLGPLISGLNVLFGVWNNLIPIAGMVIDQVTAAITRFVDGGTGMLGRITTAWGPLGDAIQNVWDKLKLFAGEDVLANLPARFEAVVEAIKETWAPLSEFVRVVWDEAVAFAQRIWEEEFMPWWNETASPWLQQAIQTAFSMAWDAAVAVVSQRLSIMIAGIQNAIFRIPGIVASGLAAVPGIAAQAFSRAASAAIGGARAAANGAAIGFRALVSAARRILSEVHNAVLGAFAGAGGWLVGAGRAIIDGLLSGIRGGFDRVRGLLSQLTGMLPNWKGPADVDRKILRESGRLVMQGFEAGLRDQAVSVRSTLAGLTTGLPSMVGSQTRAGIASMSGVTFNINVSGATGESAGTAAAEAVLARLAQAGLVRGQGG